MKNNKKKKTTNEQPKENMFVQALLSFGGGLRVRALLASQEVRDIYVCIYIYIYTHVYVYIYI